MERLEEELRRSLERRAPAGDFTARVMGRVRGDRRWQRSPLFRWALAGAIAASLVAGIFLQQRQERIQRERAEAAREQLILSLQIASAKFNKARQAVLQTMKETSI